MSRHLLWVLMVLPVGGAGVSAPAETKSSAPRPNEVEVRFADGSAVRMNILQEHLEVVTRYGKLTVPTAEVRRIDFAFRLPDELSKRIETAITKLGDNSYEERQKASKELAEIGLKAFPALREASRTADAESGRRIAELLKQIRAKVPASQLRFHEDDQVQTIKFTIAGRIVGPAIKARSAYFSDGQVQVADLRSMRWLVAGGETSLTVDAARYGSAADQWMETEVMVNANERLTVAVSGQVDLWPQQPGGYMSGPSGYQNAGRNLAQLPGALLGRIGESGQVFVIGERFEGTPAEEGTLYLHIVPSPWNNPSSGSYAVKITSGQ